MEKTLFGTDGIRGVAGEAPLDSATVRAIGISLGRHVIRSSPSPRVLIGQDTRESGSWIAAALALGLRDVGVRVEFPGVITTPGLAHLSVRGSYTAAAMVSASHNPYQDNGIKIFGRDGFKLPDEIELALEKEIHSEVRDGKPWQEDPPELEADRSLLQPYLSHLLELSKLSGALPGQSAVVDCANGAATALAREVFSSIPFGWIYIGDRPDGRNINLNCGSLHLELLRSCVLQAHADFGVAFDGDADRALFVDASGNIVNGDAVLLIASSYMKAKGTLRSDAVVGTVMSNLGLERALEEDQMALYRTPVGDKYVLEEMLRCGANLGGEQSGHIIFSDFATTGDGLLTALQLINIMAEEAKSLEQLAQDFHVYPQKIRNIPVRDRIPLNQLAGFQNQLRASEQTLGSRGRIVVRYSGTELLLRIMVEAETDDLVNEHINALEQALAGSMMAAPSAARSRSTAPSPAT